MKLIMEAVVVELDNAGLFKSRAADCAAMALRLDGSEIDGVRFSAESTGGSMTVTMEGGGLSEEIRPNYPSPPHSPVMQISFREPEAKFTANTLNKLIRKANKAFPDKALMVRDVKMFIG